MNQKGLTPILVVVFIAVTVISIGGYLVYRTKPTSSQPVTTPSPVSTTQSSPNSTTTPKPKVSIKPVVSTKPTPAAKVTPTPTAVPSPSPSGSPSPASKPSPAPGVYQLNLKPTSNIETSTSSYGYAASILLTDSNGDVIYDQSDISFSASIDNPNLALIQLDYDDGNQLCKLYNIKYEEGYHICPNFRLDIVPKQAGSTKIPIKAIQKSTGKIVAEGAYSLTIK